MLYLMIVLNSPMSDITSLYTSLGVVQLHTGLSVVLLYLVLLLVLGSVYFSPGGYSLNPRGRKYRITVLNWDRSSRAQLQVQLNMIGWILINHLVFSVNYRLTFELTRSVLYDEAGGLV